MVVVCCSAVNEQMEVNKYNCTAVITLLFYQHSLYLKSAVGHSKTTNMERTPLRLLAVEQCCFCFQNLFYCINIPSNKSSLLYFFTEKKPAAL